MAEPAFGVDISAGLAKITNSWRKTRIKAEQLLTEAKHWATLDYHTVNSPDASAEISWRIDRTGLTHGIALWFDTELAEGIGFSNGPGAPETIYGNGFLPFPRPVVVREGECVEVRIRADLIENDYVWTWDTNFTDRRSDSSSRHFSGWRSRRSSCGRNMREAVNRPEHEVVLCIARRDLDAGRRTSLRDLFARVQDWEYLVATASIHGLLPLLHKHLQSNVDLVPVGVRSRIKREAVANATNVLHLAGKQLKLYRLFKDHDIPVAVFKGAALAEFAYGDISLRQAGDIDVLISRADFARARLLLESLGYEMTPQLTAAQLASHLATHCEIQFVRDDWFTIVDLHWALAPKSFVFKMDTDELLSRLQPVTIAGTEIETLATEDLIVYLSMHGAKHLWRALEWMSSLGELIRSAETIDWQTVIDRAAKAHATRMLGLALRLVESVSGGEIVSQVVEMVDKDQSMKRMAEEVLVQSFAVTAAAVSTETNLYNLKIMDRKRDALVSALRAIFVPTMADWSTLNLPPSLHSLYYAYRPLRLSRAYTSALWRRLASQRRCMSVILKPPLKWAGGKRWLVPHSSRSGTIFRSTLRRTVLRRARRRAGPATKTRAAQRHQPAPDQLLPPPAKRTAIESRCATTRSFSTVTASVSIRLIQNGGARAAKPPSCSTI